MRETVSLNVKIDSPIDRVWNALTDAETLSKWMMFKAYDFKPAVGHKFQFRMEGDPDWAVVVDCEVLKVDEPNELAYTWVVKSQGHETTVTWTLTESADGGTNLHLEQSGFLSDAKQEIVGAEGGWKHMLQQLQELLA